MNSLLLFKFEVKLTYVIFFVILLVGITSAFYLLYNNKYSLLYYGDTVSHLVTARYFVDSPGFFEHIIHTSWLPLPHFLLLPPSVINSFYSTGLAGLIVSLPSLAVTSVFLYKIVWTLTDDQYIAIFGALTYPFNPNILYLGLIPMTEAPFMLFFVAAAYFFLKYYWITPSPFTLGNYIKISNKSFDCHYGKLVNLAICSAFVVLASLCRYEAWFIPIFLIIFVIIAVQEKELNRKYKALSIFSAFMSLSGIILWLALNAYFYNNPLHFNIDPFLSTAAQAGKEGKELYLQPLNVLYVYGTAAISVYGPILIPSSITGYFIIFHRYYHRIKGNSKIILMNSIFIFLSLPPIFLAISMVLGIGVMNLSSWFNSRYLTVLCPIMILPVCILLGEAKKKFHEMDNVHVNRAIGLLILFLFISQFFIPGFGIIPTFLDAQDQFYSKTRSAIKAGDVLRSFYDSDSTVLMITGGFQQSRIMHSSGVNLNHFVNIYDDNIQKESFERESFKTPWAHAKYIIIGKEPDANAIKVVSYWLDKQNDLNRHYNIEYDDIYYRVLVHK